MIKIGVLYHKVRYNIENTNGENMANYDYRIIEEKPRWVIVDETGKILNDNPKKIELKNLKCVPIPKNKYKYTDEQLLSYLRQFYEEYGRIPIQNDLTNNSKYPNHANYYRRFGSLPKAIRLAGLYANRHTSCTDEELLNYLKQFYEENGRTPEQNEFSKDNKYPHYNTYFNRFGSWNKAIEIAGLDINYHASYTDEELLNYLKQFYNETGKAPTETDFKNNKKYPSYGAYKKHFGGWQKALQLVGLDVDTLVKIGIVQNTYQKGRLLELYVKDHFDELSVDLSGENRCYPVDGICPQGYTYEVKSVGLKEKMRWCFPIYNKEKEEIEWFYLGAFNEDYSELLHVWRIPGELIEKNYICISLQNSFKRDTYCVESMKEYEITYKFKDFINGYSGSKII